MAEFTEIRTRKVSCPYCHNSKVVKNGQNANGKQTYLCKPCGKRFLHTGQVAGRHATAEQIGMAIRMYYGGTSYKQTAETMADGDRYLL
jgi:transposase-like protein